MSDSNSTVEEHIVRGVVSYKMPVLFEYSHIRR